MQSLKSFFNKCQESNDFWRFVNDSGLEWFCDRSKEMEDGSIRQTMTAQYCGTELSFNATFKDNKCELMYNLH